MFIREHNEGSLNRYILLSISLYHCSGAGTRTKMGNRELYMFSESIAQGIELWQSVIEESVVH
jgi:hypothetical protein